MLVAIVIIILFALLVIAHEWGHYISAKRNGVEVDEFGIGFPPRLWGKKVGKTVYSINLIPLGGFVRLAGEDTEEDGPGTFGAAKFGIKAKILLAGVVMNFITAVIILFVLCLVGIPALGAQFEPTWLHSTYAQPKELIMVLVEPGSPADKVGIKKDDYVTAANGVAMSTDQQLLDFTKSHAGKRVTLTVKHGSATRTVSVMLRGPNSTDGYLGVETHQVYQLKYDPVSAFIAAVYIAAALFVATIVGVIQLILGIPALIIGLFSSGVPAAAQEASGPIGIFFILQSVSSLGWSYIFVLMANIAVALAAFNVLPIPALDGGRLAIIVWQRIVKKRISAETESRIHAAGFIALICLMILVSVYDLRKQF